MSTEGSGLSSSSERGSSDTLLQRDKLAAAAALHGGHHNTCDRCVIEEKHQKPDRSLTLNIPLMGLFRLVVGIIGCFALVSVHKEPEKWWPLVNQWLFALIWIITVWNLGSCAASALGYVLWPSTRRVSGFPPVTIIINGFTVCNSGGPDEDDAGRRRRTKRIQMAIFDILLTIPSWVLLGVSKNNMSQFWGSTYIGLWPETVNIIATLLAFQMVAGIAQVSQTIESQVIGFRVTSTDIYAKDEALAQRLLV